MGDQSCGKSSVLEALSGVQFPRGSGLVTRCPVQLIMKRTKPGDGWHGEVGGMVRSRFPVFPYVLPSIFPPYFHYYLYRTMLFSTVTYFTFESLRVEGGVA